MSESASSGDGALATWWTKGAAARRGSEGPPTAGARWHAPSVSATPWDECAPNGLTPIQLLMDTRGEAYKRFHELERDGNAWFLDDLPEGPVPTLRLKEHGASKGQTQKLRERAILYQAGSALALRLLKQPASALS